MEVTLQNLTKKFPARGRKNREDVIAVNDFTFEIPDGKLIGLLGPSGCGKSTTLNLISGLLKPTSGRIFFWGGRRDRPSSGKQRDRTGFSELCPLSPSYGKAKYFVSPSELKRKG